MKYEKEIWKCILRTVNIDKESWKNLRLSCRLLNQICLDILDEQKSKRIYILRWKGYPYGHGERWYFAVNEIPETIDCEYKSAGENGVVKTLDFYIYFPIKIGDYYDFLFGSFKK